MRRSLDCKFLAMPGFSVAPASRRLSEGVTAYRRGQDALEPPARPALRNLLLPDQQCQSREAKLSGRIVNHVDLAGVETGL